MVSCFRRGRRYLLFLKWQSRLSPVGHCQLLILKMMILLKKWQSFQEIPILKMGQTEKLRYLCMKNGMCPANGLLKKPFANE
uniref:Uncharacterized protein n=1 Tax=Pyxicephalus adspersus TaxID=30357 RepID=A0AAV3APQ0_PYXAD|nr:TPA: hypothetical protein GDO54_009370 [Pyxicephalus adspersus]